jgi:chorismate lyase
MTTSGDSIWRPFDLPPPPGCTNLQWEWLNSEDSLTARLRQLSNNRTHIRLLSAGWGEIYPEEQTLLGRDGKYWVREILHLHLQHIWIWARTIIPAQTLSITQLDGASPQPLGDILFQDPHLTRSPKALALLPEQHPYQRTAALHNNTSKRSCWARRSIFWYHQQPLLIAEVFLPAFFDYAKN